MKTVFVKCNSHQSRRKLEAALGYYPQCHYEAGLTGNYAHCIPSNMLDAARAVKGVTKARNQSPGNWRKCWTGA